MSETAYKGLSKKEALDRLTNRVRDDLSKAGLRNVYFKAEDVVATGGVPAVVETVHFPETMKREQVTKAHEIIGEQVGGFFKERYHM